MTLALVVLVLIVAVNCCFVGYLISDVAANSTRAEHEPGDVLWIGVISFFISACWVFGAPAFPVGAAVYSKLKWVSAKNLPGTLNSFAVIPMSVIAFIYINYTEIDLATVLVPVAAQVAGAYISSRFVMKIPARPIRVVLACGMIVAVLRVVTESFGFSPPPETVAELDTGKLILLGGLCLLFGVLNNLGVGSFPMTATVAHYLGLTPEVAFTVMTVGATFSIPVAGIQFIKSGCYSRKVTVISAISGTLGVLAAVFAVRDMDISPVKWLIAAFLLYSACAMLISAFKNSEDSVAAPKAQKTKHRLSFVGRLTSFCVVLILLCAVSVTVTFFRKSHFISYGYVEMSINESNFHLRDSVLAYLREHENLLLSIKVGASHFMSQNPIDLENLRRYLEDVSHVLDDVSTLYCVTNEVWNQPGGYAVFSRPWDIPRDWNNTERLWFTAAKKAQGGVAYSNPYIDVITGDVVLNMSTNIYDKNGKDIGVVSESIAIETLNSMLRGAALLEGQQVFLIDAGGVFVAHPDKDMIALGNFFHETGLEKYRNEILSADPFSATDKGMAVYSSPIAAAGWFVVSVIPTEQIFSFVNNRIAELFLPPMTISFFMLLIVLISLMIITRRESRDKLTAERLTREKDYFIARVSHEIRTPMNAVIGMSELARQDYGTPKGLEYISGIKNAGNSLLSIINDILDFSKIASGRLELTTAGYETASTLNDALTIIHVQTAEKPIEFIVNIDPAIPCCMTGDAGCIKQILINLLSNAVKYTRDGFVRFTASAEPMTENTVCLTFVVEDSGIGIKPEDMPKLFDDFRRIDEKSNSAIEGTGLGLSIARSLCRAMGGDITVKSEYGKGSTFTATIPQVISDNRPMGELSAKIQIRAEAGGVRFTAPGFRVLIVDDVASNLKVAEGLLAPYEMTIDTCLSGNEALSLVRENDYDLVLMDHMMSGMDGVETTAAIRALGGNFEKLPIAALTANAVTGMKEMFLANGFDDFLSKPIEIPRLNKLVERWVPKGRRAAPRQADTRETAALAEAPFEIEGLDTAKGMATSGGTEALYRDVLELYRRDVNVRIEFLNAAHAEKNLKDFVTHAHALKSASANIGASGLSESARTLEEAGRRGDIAFIREHAGEFRSRLADMAKRIGAVLDAGKGAKTGEKLSNAEIYPILTKLKKALETEDVGTADGLLAELSAMPLDDETGEAVSSAADMVLFSEFADAAKVIGGLLTVSTEG
ncbi:MAG: ATP-binding protein [Synergistaceae bacterium]|nr:ATP-binding protein [Synergistaceae bacterium]